MATIRRNSLKAIRAMLESAALITRYYDDGQDSSSSRATVEQVMALAPRFSSVTQNGPTESGHVTICQSHFFSVYPTMGAARRCLTRQAFAKYFGEQKVAA